MRARDLRKEKKLRELKKQLRRDVKNALKKKPRGLLVTKEGGKLLKRALMEIGMSWAQSSRLFRSCEGYLKTHARYWEIHRPQAEFENWNIPLLKFIRHYYNTESYKVHSNRASTQLSYRMERETNKERKKYGFPSATLAALRTFVERNRNRISPPIKPWGYQANRSQVPSLTSQQLDYLEENYYQLSFPDLKAGLGNPPDRLIWKELRRLEIKFKNRIYTEEEDSILCQAKEDYKTEKYTGNPQDLLKAIAEKIHRTENSVQNRVYRLWGFRFPKKRSKEQKTDIIAGPVPWMP